MDWKSYFLLPEGSRLEDVCPFHGNTVQFSPHLFKPGVLCWYMLQMQWHFHCQQRSRLHSETHTFHSQTEKLYSETRRRIHGNDWHDHLREVKNVKSAQSWSSFPPINFGHFLLFFFWLSYYSFICQLTTCGMNGSIPNAEESCRASGCFPLNAAMLEIRFFRTSVRSWCIPIASAKW